MELIPRLLFQISIVGILTKHKDPIIVIKDKYVINLLTNKTIHTFSKRFISFYKNVWAYCIFTNNSNINIYIIYTLSVSIYKQPQM